MSEPLSNTDPTDPWEFALSHYDTDNKFQNILLHVLYNPSQQLLDEYCERLLKRCCKGIKNVTNMNWGDFGRAVKEQDEYGSDYVLFVDQGVNKKTEIQKAFVAQRLDLYNIVYIKCLYGDGERDWFARDHFWQCALERMFPYVRWVYQYPPNSSTEKVNE